MSISKYEITEFFCFADDFCRLYDRFFKIDRLTRKRDKSERKPSILFVLFMKR